jgi:hypothetical protein
MKALSFHHRLTEFEKIFNWFGGMVAPGWGI